MSLEPAALAAVAVGYLLGSIDFGVLVPRVMAVDIYAVGSGNPGASNVLRTMGRGAAAAVMLGDVLKGVGAAALGDLAVGQAVGFAAGFAAVLGHCFPVWHGFRGGKGVAAAAGMTFWLEPLVGLAMAAAWGLLVAATKRASIASLVVVIAYVPALALAGYREWPLVWAAAVTVLVVFRHRENIGRLAMGAEHTVDGPSS